MKLKQIPPWLVANPTIVLVAVTAYYAVQTRRQADFTVAILKTEQDRWMAQTRPYPEVRFVRWGETGSGPRFEVLNLGGWAAIQVRFDGSDLAWSDMSANSQGWVNLGPTGRAGFYFLREPVAAPGKTLTEMEWSSEFRIRYNDVGGYREFADKWRFGVKESKPFLLKVNATQLQKTPPQFEDYVLKQGPQ